MNNRTLTSLFLAALLVCLFVPTSLAQEAESKGASAAAARLRAMYFARDYEGAYRDGKALTQQYPQANELQAWFLLNMSRFFRYDDAFELAEKVKASNEKDPWAWFAFAAILNSHSQRSKEALAASEKVIAALPDHPDAIWLRSLILIDQDSKENGIAFIEKNLAKLKNPAEVLNLKAYALYNQSQSEKSEEKKAAAFATYEEARKTDPNNVVAHHSAAQYLTYSKRYAEAYPLAKKAIALAPLSTLVHENYWRTVMALPDRAVEAKQKEVEDDIASLLAKRGSYLGLLFNLASQYETLKLKDKKREIEDRILQLDAMGPEAEWVLTNRARQLASEIYQEKEKKDPAKQEAYRKMLREFIGRPRHYNQMILGEAYRNLFNQLKDDPTVSNSDLLAVAKGMVQYERMNVHSTYPVAAITLAERKTNFREAEAWAREGIIEAKKKIDSQRQFYKTDAEYEKGLNWMTAMMYDALGWVFYQEGRQDDAERELLNAHKLDAENLTTLYHIGQFYQAQKNFEKAEEYFIKGSLVATPGENKNAKALKAMYELRNGGLDGYDKYLAKVGEIDTANRKVKVLADRIKEPKLVTTFNLKTLDGKMLSSADLKGKVVVINYWGIWCGWCVEEMPDFQKLHEKYKTDADVVILTINNDQNPADVPKWMQKFKYNFNVLLDDGYVSDKAQINSFPTTWFIDKDGRIAFVKVGWTQKLTEEFSWRIEALKAKEVAAK